MHDAMTLATLAHRYTFNVPLLPPEQRHTRAANNWLDSIRREQAGEPNLGRVTDEQLDDLATIATLAGISTADTVLHNIRAESIAGGYRHEAPWADEPPRPSHWELETHR